MKKKGVMKTVVYTVLAVIALFLILLAVCSKNPPETKDMAKQNITVQSSPKGQEWGDAPDFTLPRLEGGTLTLSSLKGKVIIIDFWSTQCPPCKEEIPGFIELYEQYNDAGLEIVGMCLDSKAAINTFARKTGIKINYPLVFANRHITLQYGGIRYIPTAFIIDSQGNIAKKHVGYAPKSTFEKEIKKLLNKSPE